MILPLGSMGKIYNFDDIKNVHLLVYRLKSVEAIKMKFVAPMPEQIATTTIHFLKVSGKLC